MLAEQGRTAGRADRVPGRAAAPSWRADGWRCRSWPASSASAGRPSSAGSAAGTSCSPRWSGRSRSRPGTAAVDGGSEAAGGRAARADRDGTSPRTTITSLAVHGLRPARAGAAAAAADHRAAAFQGRLVGLIRGAAARGDRPRHARPAAAGARPGVLHAADRARRSCTPTRSRARPPIPSQGAPGAHRAAARLIAGSRHRSQRGGVMALPGLRDLYNRLEQVATPLANQVTQHRGVRPARGGGDQRQQGCPRRGQQAGGAGLARGQPARRHRRATPQARSSAPSTARSGC